MSNFKYEAPKLTKYGKVANLIEAGSVAIITADVTGDGVPDTLFDTNGDGIGDVIVGGANGGVTPVTQVQGGVDYGLLDADGDGLGGIYFYIGVGVFARSNVYDGVSSELGVDDGWDDPARD